MVLALIVVVVIVSLVTAFTDGVFQESRATTHTIERSQALFTAQSGVWAAVNWLSQGNDSQFTANWTGAAASTSQRALAGNITRSTASPPVYAAQSAGLSDADGDGVYDFSADPVFKVAANRGGYFEVRILRVTGPLDTTFRIVARGVKDDHIRTVEAWTRREAEGFRPFARGAHGESSVLMNSNVFTDSYASKSGPRRANPRATSTTSSRHAVSSYYDDPTHGRFAVRDPQSNAQLTDPVYGGNLFMRSTTGNKADAKGDVSSNGNIRLNGSAQVHGDATPGVGKTVTLDSNNVAVSGSTTPHTQAVQNPVPTVTAPTTADNGSVAGMPARGSAMNLQNSGTTTYDFKSLGDNPRIVLSSIDLNSNRTVVLSGNAGQVIDIYVTSSNKEAIKLNSSCHILINPPGQNSGPTVRIHTQGGIVLNSGCSVNRTGDPIQLQFYSSFNHSSDPGINFNSEATSQGAFYAPRGHAIYNSAAEFFGAVVARSVTMNSGVLFHYDESLADLSTSSSANYLYTPRAMKVRQ
ncbi:MAG: hypothetical protein KF878_02990 [Planctomycetes bacterium]|nr:hypothetical protein [Planctomycetota bacterium]